MKPLNTLLATLVTAGALMLGGCETNTGTQNAGTPPGKRIIHSQAAKRLRSSSIDLRALKQKAKRIVNVGLAKDSIDCKCFDYELAEANLALSKYGIFLELAEQIQVSLPGELSELEVGIEHSFSSPEDYYFTLTSSNSYRGKEDYSINSMTERRICLVDRDLNHENLNVVISQEILRFLAGKEDIVVLDDSSPYFLEIPEKEVRRNLTKQFFKPEQSNAQNYNRHRNVTINMILDGTAPEKAGELVGKASERFNRDFNISFRILGVYNYELPTKGWDFNTVYQKIVRGIKNRSDLYLLFTNKDWNEQGKHLGGQASTSGFGWISTNRRDQEAEYTTFHELGHIFGANHIYLKESIMYPNTRPERTIWGERVKDTILKNKFSRWH